MLILSVLSIIAAVRTVAPLCGCDSNTSPSGQVSGFETVGSYAQPPQPLELDQSPVNIAIKKSTDGKDVEITLPWNGQVYWFLKIFKNGNQIKFYPWWGSVNSGVQSPKKAHYQFVAIQRKENMKVVVAATIEFDWPFLPDPPKTYALQCFRIDVTFLERRNKYVFRWAEGLVTVDYSIDVVNMNRLSNDIPPYREKRGKIASDEFGIPTGNDYEIIVLRFSPSNRVTGYGRVLMKHNTSGGPYIIEQDEQGENAVQAQ